MTMVQKVEYVIKNREEKCYFILQEVAKVLGVHRETASTFLSENSVPFFMVGRSKKYFLPDIMEAVEKNKWKDSGTKNKKQWKDAM